MAVRAALDSVTSAELVRHFGRWQDQAANQPVLVTHHGRDRVVLISALRYQELIAANTPAPVGTEPQVDMLGVLLEHVAQGFVAFRPDMTVSRINTTACAFLKAPREAVLGRKLDDWVFGIEDSFGYANLVRAATSGSTATFQMPSFAYHDRTLECQTFPFEDGAACLFRDITDAIDARGRADTRTAAFAAMVAHGGIGRAKLSVRGTFTEVDETFAGFAGFAAKGLARARLTDILATQWRVKAADAIEGVLEGGTASAMDVQLLTKAGAERAVRIALSPIRNSGAPTGAMVIMTDQTH